MADPLDTLKEQISVALSQAAYDEIELRNRLNEQLIAARSRAKVLRDLLLHALPHVEQCHVEQCQSNEMRDEMHDDGRVDLGYLKDAMRNAVTEYDLALAKEMRT